MGRHSQLTKKPFAKLLFDDGPRLAVQFVVFPARRKTIHFRPSDRQESGNCYGSVLLMRNWIFRDVTMSLRKVRYQTEGREIFSDF